MMFDAWQIALRDRLPRRNKRLDPLVVLDAVMGWLARAQDASGCDGVSAFFDLKTGCWAAAYPETTGYIIPTLFDYAELTGDDAWRARALRMADWETGVQLSNGAIQAGTLDAPERVPTVFNTGQVLFGWARAYRETQASHYAKSLRRAADWLVACQDEDGAWRRYSSPYANTGINFYNTRTAYGLYVAAQTLGEVRYADAARRNVTWALSKVHTNHWLPDNCLNDNSNPLTHTIAYAIRGILEVSALSNDTEGLELSCRMARAVAATQRTDGALPGRLNASWQPSVRWSCVCGNAQMSIVWLRLADLSGAHDLREYAEKAISFISGIIECDSKNQNIRGGVKGSHPFDGTYMRFKYPNWAAKFVADAIMMMDCHKKIEI